MNFISRQCLHIFFLFVLSIHASVASDPRNCIVNAITELSHLKKFQINELNFATAKKIAHSARVLKISSNDGSNYVLRISGYINDVEFENFASLFSQKSPTTRTTQIRLLSHEESKEIFNRIKKEKIDLVREMKKKFHRDTLDIESESFKISVAHFFNDVDNGSHYLHLKGIEDDLHNVIYRSIRDQKLNHTNQLNSKYRYEFQRSWNSTHVRDRNFFIKDIKHLMPETKKMTDAEIENYFIENIGKLPHKLDVLLFYKSLERIPPSVRFQIADHWSLYSTLGIADVHNNNWLIKGEQVLGIDQAERSEFFTMGTLMPDEDFSLQHPIHSFISPKVIENFLIRHTSKPMQDFLKNLTREQILKIANEARFPITETELQGILKRAQFLTSHFTANP